MSTDANSNFQQMLNSTKLGDSSGGPADSLEKIKENAINDAVRGAAKILGIGFVAQLLGQGITKAYESAGWASGSINKGASSLTVGANSKLGAMLDQVGLAAGKIDFSKLVSGEVIASAVEPMQHLAAEMHGSHISMGDGSHVTPMQTGGSGPGAGMSHGMG